MRWVFTGAATLVLTGEAPVMALVIWPIGHQPAIIGSASDVKRGAYLARASGCIACHTNCEDGGAPLLGVAALATPFGNFYSPNLTNYAERGIGGWTMAEFALAVRQGISPEEEPYYPAVTYPFHADFSDQDIADLWAAFLTVPPVEEPAPPHDVGFSFNQRWGLKLWRAAFIGDSQTEPVAGKSDEWNHGRELVRGARHCGACCTARNLAGSRITDAIFTDNSALPGGNKAALILPGALQKRGWTVANLSYALQSGITPPGDMFGGSIGEVEQNGTRFRAMATCAP